MKKIETITQLKALATTTDAYTMECFIYLSGGLRSSKRIYYCDEERIFYIHNEIDDSYQELTEKELKTKSLIHEAITKGAFYQY